ncbi:MAG: ATP-dependent Clp protease proteolytic subunit [Actinomycetota bacterium]|nr:ATP-dependent Clp protease proteolytic subunit [Actinomycetota bacterium]
MAAEGALPPDAPDFQTASLADRLREQRLLLLTGYLDDAAATRAAAQVMSLDAEGGRAIHLHLATSDGDLVAAALLADTVQLASAPVHVRCLGVVGGACLAVLAAADHRSAAAHASFTLREPRARFEGTVGHLAQQAAAHQVALEQLHARLAAATGQPVEAIATDLRRGRHLSAWEAFDYGLLDNVEPS